MTRVTGASVAQRSAATTTTTLAPTTTTTAPATTTTTAPPATTTTAAPAPAPNGLPRSTMCSGGQFAVTTGVNMRQSATTQSAVVGSIAAGTCVPVTCTTVGERVPGPFGTDDHWDQVTNPAGVAGFVTDEFVDTKGAVDTLPTW